MGKRFLLALAVLLSGSSATAGEEPEAEVKALRARVAELETANLGLERKAAELKLHLDRLLREKAKEVHTFRVPLGFDGRSRPAHLEGIALPPKPTKEQVRVYVARILRAAVRHRGGFGAQDPEVSLLEQVGPDHVDVLTEPLLYEGHSNGELYLITAVESLATAAHKELLLSRLPLCRNLVQVVVSQGWTREAAPVLLAALADHASWKPSLGGATLPTEWVQAVASLRRPETYPDLKALFFEGPNRWQTWSAIKDLPDAVLASDVENVWTWAKKHARGYERDGVAAVAAHYGHMDALEELFADPGDWPASEVIAGVTPYRVDPFDREAAPRWFRENRSRLVFDPAARRYVIQE